jgi:hypothetical protein
MTFFRYLLASVVGFLIPTTTLVGRLPFSFIEWRRTNPPGADTAKSNPTPHAERQDHRVASVKLRYDWLDCMMCERALL